MTTQAFGHFINLTGTQTLYFQNYWIGENVAYDGNTYGFLPFAFSGTTVTKSGDNQPATLALPNNDLARAWAQAAVVGQWLATCRTMIINPDNRADLILLSSYSAQIVSASWRETAIELQMASVLDAVGADVPRKKLTKQLVGSIPVTSRVRVQ